jgi:phosphonate transport system substrate-binding protein
MFDRLFAAAASATALVAVTALVLATGCGEKKTEPMPAAAKGDAPKAAAPKPEAPMAPMAPKAAAAPKDDRASWPKTLNVSAIPDVSQNTLLTTYEPFAAWLAKDLGIEVKFTPVTDYQATVDGLVAGRLDMVWYGGYTSVQAFHAAKGNVERLVCRAEDLKFKSVFVAAPDSGIKTLADLKGKTFTFGSNSSTSGHLMPRSFLMAAGLNPEKDFANVGFSGAHDKTAKAVEAGAVQAGALNFKTWDKMVAEKKVDTTKVAVFFTTPEYVDYCWCARKDLPAGLRAAIKKAFLALDAAKPEDKKLLDLQTATKYVECDDAKWKGIEDAAKAAGMLKD